MFYVFDFLSHNLITTICFHIFNISANRKLLFFLKEKYYISLFLASMYYNMTVDSRSASLICFGKFSLPASP